MYESQSFYFKKRLSLIQNFHKIVVTKTLTSQIISWRELSVG